MRLPAPLLRNKKDVHKHTFGHVLVVAGSARMLGAGALTALAALRAGAGLVTLAVPARLIIAAQIKTSNCIMVQEIGSINKRTLATYDAVAIGPGLGRTASVVRRVKRIIEAAAVPLVIDADALFAIARRPALLRGKCAVLTPHPGEMRMLTGKTVTPANRERMARDFANSHRCVVLLKGHRSVVSDGKRSYINKTGNPGMATAGAGDVLTGMIAAFLAQGLSAFDAAKWGACLHGKAGDLAARSRSKTSLIAVDLIEQISRVLKD